MNKLIYLRFLTIFNLCKQKLYLKNQGKHNRFEIINHFIILCKTKPSWKIYYI